MLSTEQMTRRTNCMSDFGSNGSASGLAMKACAWCEQLLERPRYCKRCRAVSYCGSQCQRLHWFALHRGSCRDKSLPHKLLRRVRRWWHRTHESAKVHVQSTRRCARRIRRRIRRRARKAALSLLLGIVGVVDALPGILWTTLFVMVLLLTVTWA